MDAIAERLDLNDTTGDLIAVDNAIVVPPRGQGRVQASGVLDSSGQPVANSISWSSSTEKVNQPPAMPDSAEITDLPGSWMFGGITYGHFGHFIAESLTRIWALGDLAGRIEGLIFTPKQILPGRSSADFQRVFSVYAELTRHLGLDPALKIHIVDPPVRVERLFVPRQGCGMGDLAEGSARFREHMRRHGGADVAPEGAEKLYISRSMLGPGCGSILGELQLEEHLKAEGYRIFHPQRETKLAQLAQYKAARQIISVDSSPLHLIAYVGDAGQTVGVIERRSMAFSDYFVRQLAAFRDIAAHNIKELTNDWVPGNGHRPGRSSFGEIDFTALWSRLHAAGLITGNRPWPALTEAERDADLLRIGLAHKVTLRPLR